MKEHLQTAVPITSNERIQDGETVNYKPEPSKVIANKVKMAVLATNIFRHIFRGSNTYTKPIKN